MMLLRKVEFGLVPTNAPRGLIISPGCFFRCVVCPKPNSNALVRITNLSCPFPPWPLPDSSVLILPRPLTDLMSLLLIASSCQIPKSFLASKYQSFKITQSTYLIPIKILSFPQYSYIGSNMNYAVNFCPQKKIISTRTWFS